LWIKPDDQRVLPDADQHVTVQQEADAAEHLLLFDVLAPGQPLPNALSQGFIKGHISPYFILRRWESMAAKTKAQQRVKMPPPAPESVGDRNPEWLPRQR